MTGAGKTVWLHGLVSQLLKAETVERLVLVDLKKFEFAPRYGGHAKVTICNAIEDVPAAFEELDELMAQRETIMLEKNWRSWKEGRVFVVVDEYARIQQFGAEKRPAKPRMRFYEDGPAGTARPVATQRD
ncbi:hypothetical protein ACRQ5Q_08790 [Bradyrhizobium sp. PMVTL-01]|uniref:hypothetical protein n=1 Tax=Bradyrhizobium sp. PMVTL-01 TaxID=3434999 RepID=UPI003F701538